MGETNRGSWLSKIISYDASKWSTHMLTKSNKNNHFLTFHEISELKLHHMTKTIVCQHVTNVYLR